MSVIDNLTTETQFSVFLVNKPGVLSQIVQRLASEKVNIVAMCLMDTTDHGVLRMVVGDADKTRALLGELNLPRTEGSVMLATLPNRPGSLAEVVERLASERVNVDYAYVTTGARNGKALGIFKVSNVPKAMKVLSERKPRRKTPKRTVRPTRTGRRR